MEAVEAAAVLVTTPQQVGGPQNSLPGLRQHPVSQCCGHLANVHKNWELSTAKTDPTLKYRYCFEPGNINADEAT